MYQSLVVLGLEVEALVSCKSAGIDNVFYFAGNRSNAMLIYVALNHRSRLADTVCTYEDTVNSRVVQFPPLLPFDRIVSPIQNTTSEIFVAIKRLMVPFALQASIPGIIGPKMTACLR